MSDNIVAPPKTRGGEFFAIDKAPFEAACKLGLNPAVAYLAVTRGAGRDNAASFWSVNAIEQHTGMSRPKAKAALQALIDCGLFKKERGGARPRYRIGRSDEPQWIWLPNAIVDGAADEIPPLRLLRQMQDVRRLRLFVAMYDSHDLANDGGISRTVLWQNHTLTKEGNRGASTIWAFEREGISTVSTRSPLFTIYAAPGVTGEARETATKEFWGGLRAFRGAETGRVHSASLRKRQAGGGIDSCLRDRCRRALGKRPCDGSPPSRLSLPVARTTATVDRARPATIPHAVSHRQTGRNWNRPPEISAANKNDGGLVR